MATPGKIQPLLEMFENINSNMTDRDADRLKSFSVTSGLIGSLWMKGKYKKIPRKVYRSDAFSFFRYLVEEGKVDDTNLSEIKRLVAFNNPELLELVTTRAKKDVQIDPVVDYLEKSTPPQLDDKLKSPLPKRRCSERIRKKRNQSNSTVPVPSDERPANGEVPSSTCDTSLSPGSSSQPCGLPHRYTCDVRLRVKAEYLDQQEVLAGNITTNKEHPVERQFDRFLQASTILKSRDLGSVVCDIKFSELTYLDAFWRDYINGSLLEALKGVFITGTLQQAVGMEPLRLLVSVDEDDYRAGRLKLLKNLTG